MDAGRDAKPELISLKLAVLGDSNRRYSANFETIAKLLPVKAPITIEVNNKPVSFRITNLKNGNLPEPTRWNFYGSDPVVVTVIEDKKLTQQCCLWEKDDEDKVVVTITDQPQAKLGKSDIHNVVLVHDCKSFDASANLLRKIYSALRKTEVILTKDPQSPRPDEIIKEPQTPSHLKVETITIDGEVTPLHRVTL